MVLKIMNKYRKIGSVQRCRVPHRTLKKRASFDIHYYRFLMNLEERAWGTWAKLRDVTRLSAWWLQRRWGLARHDMCKNGVCRLLTFLLCKHSFTLNNIFLITIYDISISNFFCIMYVLISNISIMPRIIEVYITTFT